MAFEKIRRESGRETAHTHTHTHTHSHTYTHNTHTHTPTRSTYSFVRPSAFFSAGDCDSAVDMSRAAHSLDTENDRWKDISDQIVDGSNQITEIQ